VKHVKYIVLALSLFLLLAGNIGVNVFKHICEKDGVSVSYFFNYGHDHCEEDKEDLPTCCKKAVEKKKDCCDDEVEQIKIDFDFAKANDNEVCLPLTTIYSVQGEKAHNTELADHYISNYVNPPPPDSRRILVLKQVYII
jgi:hypothetical protein